jgi:hypothetical protein
MNPISISSDESSYNPPSPLSFDEGSHTPSVAARILSGTKFERREPKKFKGSVQTKILKRKKSKYTKNKFTRDGSTLRHIEGFVCRWCVTSVTSETRKGPEGGHTLCNACGIKWSNYNKRLAPLPEGIKKTDLAFIVHKENCNIFRLLPFDSIRKVQNKQSPQ